ncbi:MAG: 2-hydroxyacid dehydrogenase [Patescibacteria group bacterium]
MKNALLVDIIIEIPKPYLDRITRRFSIQRVKSDSPDFNKALAGADAIFCNISTKVSKKVIDAAPKLKYIGTLSTAYDGVDAAYAHKKGIVVCNLGGYSTEAVAEWTIAVLFEHMRELERAKVQARTGDYSFASFVGTELAGKTLGVVGTGKIGSRVAEIGHGIGMKVLYFSRHRKNASLEKLLKASDVISLNVIQNESTDGMIGKKQIGLMKQGVIFINTAGSRPIDWNAMRSVVKSGKVHLLFHNAHGLDPAIIKELSPLKNVEFYPGIAFRTKESMQNMFETFTSNIEQFLKGKPQNVVN